MSSLLTIITRSIIGNNGFLITYYWLGQLEDDIVPLLIYLRNRMKRHSFFWYQHQTISSSRRELAARCSEQWQQEHNTPWSAPNKIFRSMRNWEWAPSFFRGQSWTSAWRKCWQNHLTAPSISFCGDPGTAAPLSSRRILASLLLWHRISTFPAKNYVHNLGSGQVVVWLSSLGMTRNSARAMRTLEAKALQNFKYGSLLWLLKF